MLTGAISVEQWLKDGDEARDRWLDGTINAAPVKLGACEETFTRLDTALMVGQTYRDVTGADIALVYVNCGDQGVNCRIFAGDVTSVVANNVMPDRTAPAGEGLATGTLTGQQIIDCLNGMNSTVGNSNLWYFVASGLNVEFAPWMPVGKRLVRCSLPDGSELDPEGRYLVAFMSDKLFTNEGGEPSVLRPEDERILEGKWVDFFAQWMADHDGVLKRPEQTTVLNWKTEA